jgi:hypothetical protein
MGCPDQLTYNLKLFSMKGSLAFAGSFRYTYTAVHVWVMQDYEAEFWSFKYMVDLSVVEASRQLHLTSFQKEKEKERPLDLAGKWIHDMAALNERELLIMCDRNHLLRCDIDGNFIGMVDIGNSQYCIKLTQLHLKESIIPAPYHGMKGVDDKEEPFSMEHA